MAARASPRTAGRARKAAAGARGSCAMARCSSRRASASRMFRARRCRPRPASRDRNWPALHGVRSACRWCCIRAIRTCRPRTPTCVTSARCAMAKPSRGGSAAASTSRRSIPFDEDVLHWHRTARALCAPFGDAALRRAQALVRRIFLPQASRRDARRRRAVLRRPAHRFRKRLRLPARGWRRLPRCLPADRRAAPGRRRSASASASSSCTGADATSNSTWSTTAARCSGCSRAGARSRS